MSKKILMLISTWDSEYSKAIILGISERMRDADVTLHIFNAYDDFEEMSFDIKDREIYTLPRPEQYDGLIISFNSVASGRYLKDMTESFIKLGKPVVSIDRHCDGAIFCGLDNYDSMYQIVEHMVTMHDARTFNYVGGPADHEENLERFRAFCDCLRKHGIAVEKKRIIQKSFLRSDGADAYREFKERGLHLPDAVICANDYMALGYIEAAREDGFSIPKDVKVTGFDDVFAARLNSPSVTTIDRNLDRIGYDALSALLSHLEDHDSYDTWLTRGHMQYNETCGCERHRNIREAYEELLAIHTQNEMITNAQGRSRKILCSSTDIEQLKNAVIKSRDIVGISKVAVYLNESFFDGKGIEDKIGYDTEMRMYSFSLAERNSKGRQYDICITDSVECDKGLYPAVWDGENEKIILYSSLHFNEQTLGYCAMPYRSDFFTRNLHRVYTENLSLALKNIYQRASLDSANAQLKELYVRDSLTGLYNRFGYAAKAASYYEQNDGRIYVVYLDLDNLKTLNDSFGHAWGDKAIQAVAASMREVFTDTDILVRMGGDEFLIVGKYDTQGDIDAGLDRLCSVLLKHGKDNDFPLDLKISAGSVYNDERSKLSLEQLVQEADDAMYNMKQLKKGRSIPGRE